MTKDNLLMNIKAIIDSTGHTSTPRQYPSGIVKWYNDSGLLDRADGPAVIMPNGTEEWYRDGLLHRVGGPAVVDNSGEVWYQDGEVHREDGPAIIERGGARKYWFLRGKQHRLDGPAFETTSGVRSWWVHDRRFTEDEFYRYVDQDTGEVLVPPGKKLTYDGDHSDDEI